MPNPAKTEAKGDAFDKKKSLMAMLKLAELRVRQPDDPGVTALAEYVLHLESEVAKIAPTHMAKVWRENERLKDAVERVTSAFEPDMDAALAGDERDAVQKCRKVSADLRKGTS